MNTDTIRNRIQSLSARIERCNDPVIKADLRRRRNDLVSRLAEKEYRRKAAPLLRDMAGAY